MDNPTIHQTTITCKLVTYECYEFVLFRAYLEANHFLKLFQTATLFQQPVKANPLKRRAFMRNDHPNLPQIIGRRNVQHVLPYFHPQQLQGILMNFVFRFC